MTAEQFEFPELPIEPIKAGQTILLKGPGRMASTLARKLTFGGGHDDGVVFISTNTSGSQLAEDCRAEYPDIDFSNVGIIDATGRSETETNTGARIEGLTNTGDLTGISIKNSILSTHLQKRGVSRIRTCFDSLSMLLLYTNFQVIMRFVHTVDGRIAATNGLGVFVLDASMHDPQVEYTLNNFCDCALEIRDGTDGLELRIEGLRDQSRDWQPFDLY